MNQPVLKHKLLKTYCTFWAVGILLCYVSVKAQNLIPNPSFEDFNNALGQYTTPSEINFPGIKDWFDATLYGGVVTSYALETWRGNVNLIRPYHGSANGLLGFVYEPNNPPAIQYAKLFLQCRLLDSLKAGCTYRFTMYVLPTAIDYTHPYPLDSLATSKFFHSTRNIGAYFSKKRIFDSVSPWGFSFDTANINPQVKLPSNGFITDTTNYTRINGTFVATGGEQYLTLGSFDPVSSSPVFRFRHQLTYNVINATEPFVWCRFHVDSLNLHRLPPSDTLLTSSSDTSVCPGDSLQLFTHAREANSFRWDDGSTDSLRTITQPGTYYVDAYYNCGDILSDTIVVAPLQVLPAISVNDTTVCEGEVVRYSLPANGVNYTLNGSPVGSSFSVSVEGQYLLNASNTCESWDFTFELSYKPVEDLPNLNLKDTALCSGEEMTIDLPAGFTYTLNGAEVKGLKLPISQQAGYTLEADNSCATRTYNFTINGEGCEMELYIPNAFTPNGDGLNDCFEIYVTEYESFHVMVFNRWGQQVFESYNPAHCWDGSFDGQTVFGNHTYVVRASDGGQERVEYGIVTVLR
jgi:gliding motility-associated-like protein